MLKAANAPDDATLRRVLEGARTIAVVGASSRWDRPSCRIMQYLQAVGYRIFPVNPNAAGGEILGRPVYASLAELPEPIDIVNVFRKPAAVGAVVAAAIAIGAKAVWLQKGVAEARAAARARAAGLDVIEDRCIKTEHFRLFGGAGAAAAARLDSDPRAA
ncbi:MAG TPA: CoA-binding protein [Alphaproteobacteria bacterium]